MEDSVVVGLITNNDEKVYVEGVEKLSHWSVASNLFLNISKRKNWWWTLEGLPSEWRTYTALTINNTPVKRVSSFRYLSVHICKELS